MSGTRPWKQNRSDLRDGEPGGAGSQACEFAHFPTKFSGARSSSQVGQLVGARSGAGGRLAGSHRLGATLSLEEEPTAKTCPRAGAGPSRESPDCPQTGAGAATGRGRLAVEGSFLASPVPPLKQPQTGTEGLTRTGGRADRRTGREDGSRNATRVLARLGGVSSGGLLLLSLALMPSEAAVRPRPGPAPRRGKQGARPVPRRLPGASRLVISARCVLRTGPTWATPARVPVPPGALPRSCFPWV